MRPSSFCLDRLRTAQLPPDLPRTKAQGALKGQNGCTACRSRAIRVLRWVRCTVTRYSDCRLCQTDLCLSCVSNWSSQLAPCLLLRSILWFQQAAFPFVARHGTCVRNDFFLSLPTRQKNKTSNPQTSLGRLYILNKDHVSQRDRC